MDLHHLVLIVGLGGIFLLFVIKSKLTTAQLIIGLSLTSFLMGVGGLAWVHTLDPSPKPWHYLLFELFALLGSVGLVGIFFEFFVRRKFSVEFEASMRNLFYLDPTIAEKFKPEDRAKFVKTALRAHLGDDQGQAIYDAIVRRYLQDEAVSFRKDVLYEVYVRNLPDDIVVGDQHAPIVLEKSRYYQLLVRYQFKRVFKGTGRRTVGCILEDDPTELNKWFDRQDCIFREMVILAKEDRSKVISLLGKLEGEKLLQNLGSIFKLSVEIDGKTLRVNRERTKPTPSGKSTEMWLDIPRGIKEGEVLFKISVDTVIDKYTHQYPVVLVDPCSAPQIIFDYSGAEGIKTVVPATFFASGEAFKPDIDQDSSVGKVKITAVPKGYWVFPSSGVVFTWYLEGGD